MIDSVRDYSFVMIDAVFASTDIYECMFEKYTMHSYDWCKKEEGYVILDFHIQEVEA